MNLFTPELEALREKFPAADHRSDERGFTYIEIQTMQERLDEATEGRWTLEVTRSNLTAVPGMTYGRRKAQALIADVAVSVTIYIKGSGTALTRAGVGADVGDDPDKVIKTALANAIKKALNAFGVGRYLWNEEDRDALELAQRGERGDVAALKKRVHALAGGGTPQEIAERFEVDLADLSDPATLQRIIEENLGDAW